MSRELHFVEIVDPDTEAAEASRRALATVGVPARCWRSPDQYLEAVPRRSPAAFVVEVRQPGMSGLELLRTLRDRGEDAAFVFVSRVDDVSVAVAAMKAGASDFLQKPVASQQLIDVVQDVLRDRSRGADRRAAAAACRNRVASLTPREKQVLAGVLAGRSNRVIAAQLGLSEKTVEEYRGHMMSRLGASSVADAVKIGLVAGVCDPVVDRRSAAAHPA